MKNISKAIICLAGIATVSSFTDAKVISKIGEKKSPNLVFIMADQWRGNFLGFRGVVPVQTPNLANLSREGISFNNAMSCYPVSSPSRACWLTGVYPVQNKVLTNCNSESAPYGVELEKDARCWSDVLHDEGYATGYIGKWHLDSPYKPFVVKAMWPGTNGARQKEDMALISGQLMEPTTITFTLCIGVRMPAETISITLISGDRPMRQLKPLISLIPLHRERNRLLWLFL